MTAPDLSAHLDDVRLLRSLVAMTDMIEMLEELGEAGNIDWFGVHDLVQRAKEAVDRTELTADWLAFHAAAISALAATQHDDEAAG